MIGLSIAGAFLLPRGTALKELFRTVWKLRGPFLAFIVLANLPDLDYLPGIAEGRLSHYHHVLTHTAGWALLTSIAAWCCWRAVSPAVGWKYFAVICLALVSHLGADMVTHDTSGPYGIMVAWPLSDHYIMSPVYLFMSVNKGGQLTSLFQSANLVVIGWEFLATLPLAVLVVWRVTRKSSN